MCIKKVSANLVFHIEGESYPGAGEDRESYHTAAQKENRTSVSKKTYRRHTDEQKENHTYVQKEDINAKSDTGTDLNGSNQTNDSTAEVVEERAPHSSTN